MTVNRNTDVNAGLEAYERHNWRGAYQLLSPLLESKEEAPELVEVLGAASWWVGDIDTTIDARQRAYTEYSATGQAIDAARMATKLAEDHLLRLQSSTANGWLAKAKRLLQDAPGVPEQGHLMRLEAVLASGRHGGASRSSSIFV